MSKENCCYNWEAECDKLRNEMNCMINTHSEEQDALKRRIAELECDLAIYDHKWSVIEMIFGK